MGKTFKILKINLLSLIALPLLLIATACKLIAKALEKVAVVLGMIGIAFALIMIFEILKNPESGLQIILYIIAICVIGFVIIAVLILLFNLAASIIALIWSAIIGFFEAIYDLTYTGFLHLYATCENDYQFINLNGKTIQNALICPFYTLLHFVNKLIITIISFALPASIVLSVLLVVSTLLSTHNRVKATFGIGLFEFIQKFDTFSIVYGIVAYVAFMAIFVVVLLSLGIEWYEWARELKMTSDELAEDIAQLQDNNLRLAANAREDSDTCSVYMRNLEEHMGNLDLLGDLVEEVLNTKDNPLLRSNWGNYFRNLSEIVEECAEYEQGIPMDKFKRLIPRIQQLDKQRTDVKEMASKLLEINRNPVSASLFFAGCDTPEKLEKRYKSLCKAYHPDSEGGDTETFQKMQEEYADLKAHLSESM